MALIYCPECETQVSDKADKCPRCSYPINPAKRTKNNSKPNLTVKPKEGCFLQTLNVGCIIVAVVVGIILLWLLG